MRKTLLVLSAATVVVAGAFLILWPKSTGSRVYADQLASQKWAGSLSPQEVAPKTNIKPLPIEKIHDMTFVFSDGD